MIRFLKHKIVNDQKKTSAKIYYSLDNRVDGRKCVTLYGKGYQDSLSKVFDSGVINNSDSMTDYFEKDKVVLFEDSPYYKEARKAATHYHFPEKEEQDNPKKSIKDIFNDLTPEGKIIVANYATIMKNLGVKSLGNFQETINCAKTILKEDNVTL